MAWPDELLPAVRGMIGDDGAAPAYTDAQLKTLACVSAGQLNLEAGPFAEAYAASVAALTITPDPAGDPDYLTLLSLKTACAVSRGQVVKTAGQAIRIVDNKSEIDLRQAFQARLAAADGNWCAAYAAALSEYRKGQLAAAPFGRAVVTPPGRDGGDAVDTGGGGGPAYWGGL